MPELNDLSARRHLRAVGIAAALLVFALISALLPTRHGARPARALGTTNVCGPISSDTTWPGGVYLATCSLTVNSGVSLSLSAGTILKFNPGTSLKVSGSLVSKGTDGSPVTLTSLKDDSVGGDTNGDGTTTTPAAGDWVGVLITANNASVSLDHTGLLYGGNWFTVYCPLSQHYAPLYALDNVANQDCGVQTTYYTGNTVEFTNSSVQHSASGGIRLANATATIDQSSIDDAGTGINLIAGTTSISGSTISNGGFTEKNNMSLGQPGISASSTANITIQNSSIQNNTGDGLFLSGILSLTGLMVSGNGGSGLRTTATTSFSLTNSTFTGNTGPGINVSLSNATAFGNSGNAASGNGRNGFGISGTIASTMPLPVVPGLPYFLPSQSPYGLAVLSGVTLTLPAGATIKGDYGTALRVAGNLVASGTAGSPVTLTSLKDDSVGGDTNGDGTTTTPAAGDWVGVLITANNASVSLDHTGLLYGGNWFTVYCPLSQHYAPLYALDNVANQDCGVQTTYYTGNTVEFTNSSVQHSASGGIRLANATATIDQSSIDDAGTGINLIAGTTSISGSTISNGGFTEKNNMSLGQPGISASSTANITIQNSSIQNNTGDGLFLSGILSLTGLMVSGNGGSGLRTTATTSFSLTNSTFTGNTGPGINVSLSNATAFGNSGNAASGNGRNGFGISGTIASTMPLPVVPGLPYFLPSQSPYGLAVLSGVTLTLPAGATIKGDYGTALRVAGNLVASGTAGSPVTLTSLKDDSVGGDTNGDGTTTTPAAGDWVGVLITANNASVSLDHTGLLYGGNWFTVYCPLSQHYAPLYALDNVANQDCGVQTTYYTGNTVEFTNSSVQHSASGGIRLANATATIDQSSIDDAGTGINLIAGTTSISGSTISNGGFTEKNNMSLGQPGISASSTANITIQNSSIQNNTGDGLFLSGILSLTGLMVSGNGGSGLRTTATTSFSLTNSTFTGNTGPGINVSLSNATAFGNSGNAASGNGRNGFGISGTIASTMPLPVVPGLPYFLPSQSPYGLAVLSGVTLTLPAGATIKGDYGTALRVAGNLVASGTAGSPVTLTSLKDDSVGGDTNGDGTTTTPAAGDWVGVLITANNASVSLQSGALRYGGYTGSPAYYGIDNYNGSGYFSGNTLSLNHWAVAYSTGGIRLGNSSLSISNSTITDNAGIGVSVSSSTATISNSSITGNTSYGVSSNGSPVTNAQGNWWGDPNGPAPYGTGNGVNNVLCPPPNETQTCTLRVDITGPLSGPPVEDAGYTWSGHIAEGGGQPLGGVVVLLSNGLSTSTNVFGDYGFAGLPATTFTATPSKTGYSFSPTSLTTAVSGNTTGQDFVGTASGGGGTTPTQSVLGIQSCTKSACSNEPVNLATGNYTYQHTDVAIGGKGLGLGFVRSYNSLDGSLGRLGYGWRDSYGALVVFDGSDHATANPTLINESGRYDFYTRNGDGSYTAPAGVFDVLTRDGGDGSFTLRRKDRSQLHFDSNGLLLSEEDRNGNTTTLAYSGGNLTTVTDPSGRTLSLAYDGSGRITSITDPLSRVTTYAYSGAGDLASVTDPAGETIAYSYDASHQLLTITDARGHVIMTNVYTAGQVTQQTNALSQSWVFSYGVGETTETDPRGCSTVHAYNASYWETALTDCLGGITTFSYDTYGNRDGVTDALGRSVAMTFDARGNLLTSTDPLSQVKSYSYDAEDDLLTSTDELGHVTSYSYDAHGNLLTTTNVLGGVTTSTYDGQGQLLTVSDPLGNVSSFTYDANGYHITATDPLSQVTTFSYDDGGRLLSATDPLGHTTSYTYDAVDRQLTVTDPLSDVTTTTWDANGNRLTVSDANGMATSFVYDSLDRLSQVTDAAGGVVQYGYDSTSNRTAMTDANGHVTTYAYDLLGRLTTVSDPLSNVTTYTYEAVGNRLTRTDANGATTTYSYDLLDRLLKVSYPDQPPVSFTYDALGNRLSMKDLTGTTTYAYDALSRLVSTTDGSSNTVGYAYDADSRRTSLVYPDSKTVAYAYDTDSRLATVTDWAARDHSYSYDAASELTGISLANGVSTAEVYDAAGRLTSITHSKGGTLAAISYTLDPVGNRLSRSDDTGTETYGYDNLYRLTSAAYPGATPAQAYTYDAMGNRTQLTNGATPTNYTYDAGDRMLTAGSDSAAYDQDGNQLRLGNRTFLYDHENRLLQVADWLSAPTNGGRCADTNGDGNVDVLDLSGIAAAWGAHPASALYSPAFDLNHDGVINVGDLLIVATAFGQHCTLVTANTFNGDGLRIARWQSAATDRFTWDPAASLPVILQETTNAATTSFLYGRDLILSELASLPTYFHQDGLGSTVLTTDASGSSPTTFHYDVFGTPRSPTPEFAFTGQQSDSSGLTYLRARFLNTDSGRFTASDPLPGIESLTQSLNHYPYAANTPPLLTDPSGKIAPLLAAAAVGCAIGALAGVDGYLFDSLFVSHHPFSLGHAAISAGAGCVGGVVIPLVAGASLASGASVGAGLAAIAALHAGISAWEYIGTSWTNHETPTLGGLACAIATGQIGAKTEGVTEVLANVVFPSVCSLTPQNAYAPGPTKQAPDRDKASSW